MDQESTKEFKRRPIGLPDVKRQVQIRKVYGELVDISNQIEFEFRALIDSEAMKPISLDLILEFLKSEDPETWLVEKYVDAKGMKVEFLKTEKLIKSGLFDLPDYSKVLSIRTEFDEWKVKIGDLNFSFPFRKLYISEDNIFILTDEFENEVVEATTQYTKNEKQNQVLDALESLCNSLNTFQQLSITNIQKNGLSLFSPEIGLFLKIDRTNYENPVSVNPMVFKNRMLRRFTDGNIFANRITPGFWE